MAAEHRVDCFPGHQCNDYIRFGYDHDVVYGEL